ncbi:LysR family transcriptional regulator [Rhodobacteraceae bacterium CH30]|nr:LysR family transcriptional regulator [Rhodobacteraceae bacterium CH30]
MRLDLVDLRFFLLLAESGSLSTTALRFPMALSAASQRLKKLETLYGLTLVERHSRGITLSAAGELLLAHARKLIQATDKLEDELVELGQGKCRALRICGNTMACHVFLPERLGDVLAHEPEIDLLLSEAPSHEIIGQLEQGSIDIGILDGSMGINQLSTLPFARDRLVLVCAASHTLAGRTSLKFAEALDQPFVGLSESSAMQRFLQDMARLKGSTLRIRVRMPNFQTLANMVGQGCGLGILPAKSAQQLAVLHGLRIIRLEDHWAERELKICFTDWQELPAHGQKLVKALLEGKTSNRSKQTGLV